LRKGLESVEKVFEGLNGLDVSVFVEYDSTYRIVHVLDQDREGCPSVTNSIELLRPQIMRELGLDSEVESYRWWVYATDGMVSAFKWANWFHVPEDHPLLHGKFDVVMKKRREAV
jgi:hypothetical protein